MEPINQKMTVFFSYYDAAMDITDMNERCKFYDVVQKYAFYGIEPELTGMGRTIFKTIRPYLDKNHKREGE